MYSTILFIVDTSFNGFLGSGARPTSAVDSTARSSSRGIRPVKLTQSSKPRLRESSIISAKTSPEPTKVACQSSRSFRRTARARSA